MKYIRDKEQWTRSFVYSLLHLRFRFQWKNVQYKFGFFPLGFRSNRFLFGCRDTKVYIDEIESPNEIQHSPSFSRNDFNYVGFFLRFPKEIISHLSLLDMHAYSFLIHKTSDMFWLPLAIFSFHNLSLIMWTIIRRYFGGAYNNNIRSQFSLISI